MLVVLRLEPAAYDRAAQNRDHAPACGQERRSFCYRSSDWLRVFDGIVHPRGTAEIHSSARRFGIARPPYCGRSVHDDVQSWFRRRFSGQKMPPESWIVFIIVNFVNAACGSSAAVIIFTSIARIFCRPPGTRIHPDMGRGRTFVGTLEFSFPVPAVHALPALVAVRGENVLPNPIRIITRPTRTGGEQNH